MQLQLTAGPAGTIYYHSVTANTRGGFTREKRLDLSPRGALFLVNPPRVFAVTLAANKCLFNNGFSIINKIGV